MKDELKNKELLSALVDGELSGQELIHALDWAEDSEGLKSWQLYHLIGDVLRSPDLAHHSQHDLLSGLRVQIAQEPTQPNLMLAPALQQVTAGLATDENTPVVALRDPAANASVFRWKVAASFAMATAVAAVGWNLAGQVGFQSGEQLASAQQQSTTSPAIAVASGSTEEIMLRDPRLDALLATHQQYASRAALQAPADFLRNASLAARNAQTGH